MDKPRIGSVIVLCLCSILCAQAAFAQDLSGARSSESPAAKRVRWHFGFTAGPEFTKVKMKLTNGTVPEFDLVLGFHVGVALGFDVGPLTFRTGLNFLNAGALFDGEFLARDEFNVSFLTLPVDLRLSPFRGRFVRPYIFAGPGFRYGFDVKERPISLQNDIRLLNATFEAGIGVSLRIPKVPIRFSPEIRYVSDVFGIYEGELETDDGGIVSTSESVKANALRVGVLLGF